MANAPEADMRTIKKAIKYSTWNPAKTSARKPETKRLMHPNNDTPNNSCPPSWTDIF